MDPSEQRVRELLHEDPRLALAKVRLELEERLQRLHSSAIGSGPARRRLSLGRLVDDLSSKGVLPPSMATSLRDVIGLANRAVHGERVDQTAAEDLAVLGIRLANEVQHLLVERALRPAETVRVAVEEVERYRSCQYRVTTIIPLVADPVRNSYVLDQDGLDLLLEGYEEYAEFIVGIEPLPT